jgi:hypothetical protein
MRRWLPLPFVPLEANEDRRPVPNGRSVLVGVPLGAFCPAVSCVVVPCDDAIDDDTFLLRLVTLSEKKVIKCREATFHIESSSVLLLLVCTELEGRSPLFLIPSWTLLLLFDDGEDMLKEVACISFLLSANLCRRWVFVLVTTLRLGRLQGAPRRTMALLIQESCLPT